MAIQYITGVLDTEIYSVTGTFWFITRTGVLVNDSVPMKNFRGASTNNTVVAEGSILTDQTAICFYAPSVVGNHTVSIAETGFLSAGTDSVAVWLEGTGNALVNNGLMTGGGGMYGPGWANDTILNGGTIRGVRYYGMLLRNCTGTEVTNSGTIEGRSGLIVDASAIEVNNSGVIRSTAASRAAIDAATASEGLVLRNSGRVEGPDDAVLGSSHDESIANSGTIGGDARLGAGDDAFRGRSGVLDGLLFGEDGNDTLASGTGDDVVHGGFGRDTLKGGEGDDRLNGDGNNDTLIGSAGDDVLTGGGAKDVIVFARDGDDDVVTDFANGIDLSAFRFASFAAVNALAADRSGGMLLDLRAQGGGTVFLDGFQKALPDGSDLIL